MTDKGKKAIINALKLKIEALVIAIPNEEDAHDHYMELAKNYDDEASKEMFTFLAKEELMHKKKLEFLLEKLQEQLATLEKSR